MQDRHQWKYNNIQHNTTNLYSSNQEITRVGTSHIYSVNHRLFIHIFLSNLALRIEMKNILVAVCFDVTEYKYAGSVTDL